MKVAAIITHHLDKNHEYLNLCLESLRRQEGIEVDPILVATTEAKPIIYTEYKKLKVIHKERPFNTAQAYNLGVKYADQDSTHVLILNDDILFSKHLCYELASAVGESTHIVNPICSSESGYVFAGDIVLKGKTFIRFKSDPQVSFTLEDVKGCEDAIFNYPVGPRLLFPITVPGQNGRPQIGYNPFHCTMMHRGLWQDLGGMNETLDCQKDDLEFSLRAQLKHGSMSFMSTATFAFHFGGVTAKDTMTDIRRTKGTAQFKKIMLEQGIQIV